MKKGFLTMLTGISFFILLFIFSENFINGINSGLLLCANIVVPSTFPFLIAATLSGNGKMPCKLRKIAEPITRFLFRLPAEALPPLILSQLGGYLSGAKSAQTLHSGGFLTKSQAERLALFGINAGIGFSVNAVGNAMLYSRQAGGILLASLCISSLITGVLCRFTPENGRSSSSSTVKTEPFSVCLVNSVSACTNSMLVACGFVALFSGICSVIDSHIKNETVRLVSQCLLEVTRGCSILSGRVSLPVIAAVCAFGGLCVHMQIFSLTREIGIRPLRFYFFRITHSLLAYLCCKALVHFHPVETPVFLSFSQNAAVFSFSAPASISLLFLCVLLILDLDNGVKI